MSHYKYRHDAGIIEVFSLQTHPLNGEIERARIGIHRTQLKLFPPRSRCQFGAARRAECRCRSEANGADTVSARRIRSGHALKRVPPTSPTYVAVNRGDCEREGLILPGPCQGT